MKPSLRSDRPAGEAGGAPVLVEPVRTDLGFDRSSARIFRPLIEVIRGSLVERHLRCGKPTCHCARGEGHRVWHLTVNFARGRTEQVTVPVAWLPTVQRWLPNYLR